MPAFIDYVACEKYFPESRREKSFITTLKTVISNKNPLNPIAVMSLSRCASCEVESTIPSVIADQAFDELIANSEAWEQKFVDENKKNENLVKTVEEANARIQQLQSEIAELKKLQEAED